VWFPKLLSEYKIENTEITTANGHTPLMLACRNGLKESVKILLKHPEIKVDFQNTYEWTALIYACKYCKDPEIIQLLLDAGANINLQTQYKSVPLFFAYRNSSEIVGVLLRNGADVNFQDNYKTTTLMYVCDEVDKNVKIVKLLSEYKNTDINLRNGEGKTALNLACASLGSGSNKSDNVQVINFLLNNGADANIGEYTGKKPVDYIIKNYNTAYNEILERIIKITTPTDNESGSIKALRDTYNRNDKKYVLTSHDENKVLLNEIIKFI